MQRKNVFCIRLHGTNDVKKGEAPRESDNENNKDQGEKESPGHEPRRK